MPISEQDLADLMDVAHAAEFMGVSRSTVNRMIANKEIDIVRLGSGRGRVRILKRSILDHVNRKVTRAERTA